MERILINNDKIKEQIRVAHIEGNDLYDLEVEYAEKEQKIGSICNAEIISIEPSLEAAFVKFGSGRNGFLPLKEIAVEYFPEKFRNQRNISIKDVLFEGQKILVQINKEERGTKGAALSTYISLAGCYLVLMPNNPKAGGISRRIEGDERGELRNILDNLKIPEGMGIIIRTAGVGKSLEELQWDLDVLLNLWEAVRQASKNHGAPFLIHQESDIAIRAIRDHLRPDIEEIIIDDPLTFEKVHNYIEKVKPNLAERVTLYQDAVPLFSRFQIERQIDSALQRKVKLPSGGEIVIDRTEALTTIDVNSAQATKGGDIEETALNTNIEAAKEIAKQLRIRDLGGLFVIDFIDMETDSGRSKVEDCLRDAFKNDRARVQMIRISRFGLLEMSRQRLRSALNEAHQIICPRCHGQGSIRNVKSHALTILNVIEEKALKEKPAQIHAQVPVNVATYMLNEQRSALEKIETLYKTNLFIIPNPYIDTPEYHIRYIGTSGGKGNTSAASFELLTAPKIAFEPETQKETVVKAEPFIKHIVPTKQAPTKKRKKPSSLITFLKQLFSQKKETEKHTNNTRRTTSRPYKRPQQNRRNPNTRTGGAQGNFRKPSSRTPNRPLRKRPVRQQNIDAKEERNPIKNQIVSQQPKTTTRPTETKPIPQKTEAVTPQKPVVSPAVQKEDKKVVTKKYQFQEAAPENYEMVETKK
ncbi:MAG: Rne/Rng family ribonuclease [Pseudomonadota bacterium]|nr:Rne/Rng family ribonuclease [Gammaproteobacteria bacterium]MBU1629181.1 Rne/Rng family ribonuclease [Gammaproteobacteria bacterium]MBU1927156.1 Rne/Rng family ribonuclease [Gammaproteobacteria bacterium]MBU2546232.1 Rne/Rng family ribonuclease [Gammaproteobacteria bacterium]